MRGERERERDARDKRSEEIEERAVQLAVVTEWIRKRTYAGARVIEIAPIRDAGAEEQGAQGDHIEAATLSTSLGKKPNKVTRHVKIEEVKTKTENGSRTTKPENKVNLRRWIRATIVGKQSAKTGGAAAARAPVRLETRLRRKNQAPMKSVSRNMPAIGRNRTKGARKTKTRAIPIKKSGRRNIEGKEKDSGRNISLRKDRSWILPRMTAAQKRNVKQKKLGSVERKPRSNARRAHPPVETAKTKIRRKQSPKGRKERAEDLSRNG